jgi:ferredoxin-NADP reductase
MGFFVPDLAHDADVIFAVTGAGIAAALPMLQDILARETETGAVKLFWGVRSAGDLYWLDRIDALHASPRFDSAIALTQPPPDWTGLSGRIQSHVLAASETLRAPVHYLVGHGDMIRDIKDALAARGVDRKKHIRTEIFYPASKPADTKSKP